MDRSEASTARVEPATRASALGFGVAVHVVRFVIIYGVTSLVPLIGITGFYQGLAANIACSVFAAALVTWRGLWRSSGFLTLFRSRVALFALLVFAVDAFAWAVAGGFSVSEPGLAPWVLTLLLVGFNEELTSRVVVLDRLRRSFGPLAAVTLTGALFGLQHLSQFAISDRGAIDILENVALSGIYGFALAAYQWRFAWIWPLMLLHAASDFTSIHAGALPPDLWYVAIHVSLFVAGLWFVRRGRGRHGSGLGAVTGSAIAPS